MLIDGVEKLGAAASSSSSAETPAVLEELQAWLATCTEETFRENLPLKRLKTAVDVCTLPSSHERRTGVQKLCGRGEWSVKQKVRGVKRKAQELHAALVQEVVTEGRLVREKQTSLSSDSFTRSAVISSPEHSEETVSNCTVVGTPFGSQA